MNNFWSGIWKVAKDDVKLYLRPFILVGHLSKLLWKKIMKSN